MVTAADAAMTFERRVTFEDLEREGYFDDYPRYRISPY